LVKKGFDVSLFASGNSITSAKLESVCEMPYEEDRANDPKVLECLHISNLMEQAERFDIIHNHFDFLPLSYSKLIRTPMITTIHGFSSPKIIPVYKKYNASSAYISISNADRNTELTYLDTIYHGVDPTLFTFRKEKKNYLLYFGRIHPEKGAHRAIEIAKNSGYPLKIAGLIQDHSYFETHIKPFIDDKNVTYLGNVDPVLRNTLLGKAKALLHPISFEEPFGLSVLEAMMCGTPVVAFAKGSMPELIKEGVSGYLVNTIPEAVAAVGRLGNVVPEKCRAHAVANFSQDKMIESYIKAYNKVIEKNL